VSDALIADVRAHRALPDPPARRLIREAAGLSAARLAAALGVSRQAVLHWEAGTRRPRPDHERAYAELLAELKREVGW
jgi:transcriptional regulator with XRE-family HTH domain